MLGLISRCHTSCINDGIRQAMMMKFRIVSAPVALGEFPHFSMILMWLLQVCWSLSVFLKKQPKAVDIHFLQTERKVG